MRLRKSRAGETSGAAMTRATSWLGIAAAILLGLCVATPASADSVKIALTKLLSYPSVPIAMERGYFAAEGLEPELVYFDSAELMALALTSGDVDFAVSGLSAGFYTLAALGHVRVLASAAIEQPGFYNLVFLASNKAYEAGLL